MYTKNLPFEIFDAGISEAQENMARDTQLLDRLQLCGVPLLHYYDWARPSATYGHFIDIDKHIHLEKAVAHGVSLARRPTGGGIVFHSWDFAFSFLMPAGHWAYSANTLDNYKFVNEVVLEVVKEYFFLKENAILIPEHAPEEGPNCTHFCMARPTIYDAVYRGMKVAGAAQRRTKKGYLHQGTISLAFPDLALLKELLLSQEEIAAAMQRYSFAPLGSFPTPVVLQEARTVLKGLLAQKFALKFIDLVS